MRPRVSSERLTVGDLFCGAGGFSEGFKQAGFDVRWAVDNWAPASETFEHNHPTARVVRGDIMSLDPAREGLEAVDVIIGSPPCVHFSPANRGGNGDKAEGMKLVVRFLQLVRELRPRYWVMENVPGLERELRKVLLDGVAEVPGGRFPIPNTMVIDAALYGTPQNRRRFFAGSFPCPEPNPTPTGGGIALGQVLARLPDPTGPVPVTGEISDPLYPKVRIPVADLRDHFEDPRWRLRPDELRRSEQQKRAHPVYGRMVFPDLLDRPSRTITATRTRGSRSTIVVPWVHGSRQSLRTLTLRECASLQGFPITYQFWGSSFSQKDTLVGNAVAPPVARTVAHAILRHEGRRVPAHPMVELSQDIPPRLGPVRRSPKHYSPRRRFRGLVELSEWKHDRRVELDNEFEDLGSTGQTSRGLSVNWKSRLYLGYAKGYKSYELAFKDSVSLVDALAHSKLPRDAIRQFRLAELATLRWCLNGFPSGVELQLGWAGGTPPDIRVYDILEKIRACVDRHLPLARWGSQLVPDPIISPTLSSKCVAHGLESKRGLPVEVSIRLLSAAILLSLVCERLNEGPSRLETRLHTLLSGAPSPSLTDVRRREGASARPFQRRTAYEGM
jgi:DNA (cytosine-5)-methyltransferase 1